MEKFLLETDIIVDHLTTEDKNSLLVKLMQKGVCYTTVLNASELYLACKTPEEKNCVDAVLYSLKILGIHPRYSLSVHKYQQQKSSLRDSLFSVVAEINKLPVVTKNSDRYSGLNIKIIHPNSIEV